MSLLQQSDEPIIYDVTRIYIDDIDDIVLDDFMFVDDNFQLDIEIINHYNEVGMFYIPLVLMFNNLDNVTDIPSLTVFKFPNIESLLDKIKTLTDDDLNVGIAVKQNNNNKTTLSISNVTPPSTKLNLSMPSVTFDSQQGKIIY